LPLASVLPDVSSSPIDLAGVRDADLSGTTALVTGSTSGIGRLAALGLGDLGADVIVHGRDESAGRAVVADLDARGVTAQFCRADFADVSSVRALAETVRAETDGLDLLVNNAGGVFRDGGLTDLGVERTFHVNHLSPYLLTGELLDHLEPGARVVTTASAAHQGATLDLDAVTRVDGFSAFGAYSHSKLANVLFSAELARRLDAADRDVTANSFHPGAIPGSGFARFLPGPLPRLVQALDRLPGVTSVADGAAELLYVAVAPRAGELSGRYFADQRPTEPSRAARDPGTARRLWVRSAELLDIDEPLADAGETG
jgi:NAD(P)-dependent dehydrogenase (short-subunit alcohol dehydrogenase family)